MSPDLELLLAKRRQSRVRSGCDLRILCDLFQKINKNMQVHKRAILNKPMLALWATSRSEAEERAMKAAVSEVKVVGGLQDGYLR